MGLALVLFVTLMVLGTGQDLPEAGPPADGSSGVVLYLRLDDDAITPVAMRLIGRALREAEAAEAACLVVVLDTPGGLMQSTQEIVRAILASPVPVVVYVAPPGARAASAGVFITLAAHVAAMAPGTHIGAAHPVSVGGGGPGSAPADTSAGPTVMEQKVVNDAVAWVRSLAEMRGRNADWAALAVTESRSITATQALAENVVDLLADDLDDLVARLDGRAVDVGGGPDTLRTAGAVLRPVDSWWGDEVLSVISNPNVAFLLLIFGFYGILFEFYTPGWGVGGTLGAICLVLGFFGMAVLPINYAGLVLIMLALGLFVAEAFFTSFGALTLGGVVCLILGGLMLIDAPLGVPRVSPVVIVPVAVATAAITFFLLGSAVRAMRGRVQTGSEALLGSEAVVQETFALEEGRYQGLVLAHGELWRAVSPAPLTDGDPVEITGREGLTLFIKKKSDGR